LVFNGTCRFFIGTAPPKSRLVGTIWGVAGGETDPDVVLRHTRAAVSRAASVLLGVFSNRLRLVLHANDGCPLVWAPALVEGGCKAVQARDAARLQLDQLGDSFWAAPHDLGHEETSDPQSTNIRINGCATVR
jgi:hypothetical protein